MTPGSYQPGPSRTPRGSLLAVVVALVLVVSSGLAHGLWSERWQPSTALEHALARVPLVPLEFSGWKGVAQDTDAEVFRQAGAGAYWTRVFTHPDKAGAFSVILMCGRAGRMAVHTPEVCYRGAGYELLGSPEQKTIDLESLPSAQFWTARFAKEAGKGMDLKLFWAWNAGGRWQAPSSPRWTFRGEPFLYKLYVGREVIDPSVPNSEEPTLEFLRDFLPVLEAALFPTRTPPEEG